jgi:hypothetical protein
VGGAPVVLKISVRRNGVPVTRAFVRILGVVLCVAKNEIRVVKAAVRGLRIATRSGTGRRSVKLEPALCFGKVILDFLLVRPTASNLELMGAIRP